MDSLVGGLAEASAKALLELILVVALGAAALEIARSWARRGKVWVESGAGHTCMSPEVMLMSLLSVAAAAAVLVLGLIFPDTLQEPGQLKAWAGLIGGFALFALAVAPFARHTWEWDREGLRWCGAWRAVSMRWSEIARLGKTWDGRYYVADTSGRRIAWTTYTLEHEALRQAIEAARPDLRLPER